MIDIPYGNIDAPSLKTGFYRTLNPASLFIHVKWDDNFCFQLLVNHGKFIKFRYAYSGAFIDWETLAALSDVTKSYNDVIGIVNSRFYGTEIIDASSDKKGFNYNLVKDNTYIVTCTKGTNENETAVWILNTRNNTIVVTTLKAVTGISYMRGNMVFGVYCDKGIIGESCCFRMS